MYIHYDEENGREEHDDDDGGGGGGGSGGGGGDDDDGDGDGDDDDDDDDDDDEIPFRIILVREWLLSVTLYSMILIQIPWKCRWYH